MINFDQLENWDDQFLGQDPFDHIVIDGFFQPDFAAQLEAEFPGADSPAWKAYNNAIEVKGALNDWNAFGPATYQALSVLNSPDFVTRLSRLTSIAPLHADPGLNGGGLHRHGRGGKLNVHLDYARHPKLGLARKLNLIVYLNSAWEDQWGGGLGLWKQTDENKRPDVLVKTVAPRFNRAVIFDTTQQSWHGLPDPIDCPEGQVRRSMAVYYLTVADALTEERGKALFAPTAEQADDPAVLELIERRARGIYA